MRFFLLIVTGIFAYAYWFRYVRTGSELAKKPTARVAQTQLRSRVP